MKLTTTAAALIIILLAACHTQRTTTTDHHMATQLESLEKWKQATASWAELNETLQLILPRLSTTTPPISGTTSPTETESDTLQLIRHAIGASTTAATTAAAISNTTDAIDHTRVNKQLERHTTDSSTRKHLLLAASAIMMMVIIILIYAPWRKIARITFNLIRHRFFN